MRVLLDQGFPDPPGFQPTDIDATVEYVPLIRFAPELAKESTPDWMVILAAADRGFDALAVDDQELKENELCLVALSYVSVSLIAWTRGIDAITGWAQLVAYAPKIARRVAEAGPNIFLLPTVQLAKGTNYFKAVARARQKAKELGQSYPQMRRAAVSEMRSELQTRRRMDLAAQLR
jgi:hypothetical protein